MIEVYLPPGVWAAALPLLGGSILPQLSIIQDFFSHKTDSYIRLFLAEITDIHKSACSLSTDFIALDSEYPFVTY
jgi:hypothetical protein